MKIKVSEATNLQLDWAVAHCQNLQLHTEQYVVGVAGEDGTYYQPSTDWAQGGPIIEQEKIQVQWDALLKSWTSRDKKDGYISHVGPTALIAAMRRYISSRLGDEVEIPEELK